MLKKLKTRIINLYITPGTITSIFRVLRGNKSEYDFSTLSDLRKLLNNEKAKILNVIKAQSPASIYALAKFLKRDFKSVREDINLLKTFGFIELKPGSTGNRKRLKPEIIIDNLQININF